MARESLGLPKGVEVRGDAVRIRFTWNKVRRSETTLFPATKAGIAAASQLRDQVAQTIRLGLMTEARYAEFFPDSAHSQPLASPTFGVYAQLWLDSRNISLSTRNNYKSTLNLYWMPHLAVTHITRISPTILRQIVSETEWTSPGVKANAIVKLGAILKSAVADGIIASSPTEALDVPRAAKKEVAPFTQEEADRIIDHLYQMEHWPSLIYAAYFEFVFYTGMRLSEALALRWDAIDFEKRQAHVCRTIALGEVQQRTKTGRDRYVLLNDRALHALAFARDYAERRRQGVGRIKETPYIFPPSKNSEFVRQTSDVHHQWRPTLKALGIRYRPPYNCRHTYATMCLMSGMNPAFIAQQLGHSVQMLLTTYARWLSSQTDWDEVNKLKLAPNRPKSQSAQA